MLQRNERKEDGYSCEWKGEKSDEPAAEEYPMKKASYHFQREKEGRINYQVPRRERKVFHQSAHANDGGTKENLHWSTKLGEGSLNLLRNSLARRMVSVSPGEKRKGGFISCLRLNKKGKKHDRGNPEETVFFNQKKDHIGGGERVPSF